MLRPDMTTAKKEERARRKLAGWIWVLPLALLVLVLRLVEPIGPERGPNDRFVVKRIIDGDTMELQGGDRLRLLALDTPEKGEPLYSEAAELLERLALGRQATIEYADTRRDRYGRLLGFLYIDTLLVNRTLLDSGLAYLYLFEKRETSNPAVAQMLAAQQSAIERKVGLWGIHREPEDFYVSPPGSLRLHRPGCSTLGQSDPTGLRRFATREEGLATGLSPCRVCKP